MLDDIFSRTRLLLKDQGFGRLQEAHVLVVGLGGVGGYAAEMLCRAGVGQLTLVDGDTVSVSNINRQIIALNSTVGQSKAVLFRQRLLDINPECHITVIDEYLRDDSLVQLLQKLAADGHPLVVDCIDTLSPKVYLLYHSVRLGLPVVSSMGSGGKLDPSLVQTADISETHSCPLAAVVRKRLRRLGVSKGIRVVFSPEEVPQHAMQEEFSTNHRTTLGTISYMPPLFGCFLAAEAIKQIITNPNPHEKNTSFLGS
jgi:tRNA A37 threonylcarbamoyladenosine dehydratase